MLLVSLRRGLARAVLLLVLGAVGAVSGACVEGDGGAPASASAPTALTRAARAELLTMRAPAAPPVDRSNAVADDLEAARLGHALFFDASLSATGQVSCASCHDPAYAFSDPSPLSQGIGPTKRRAMTLLNVAFGRWFFWDGRADSLWAQAMRPLEDPMEHGADRLSVVRVVAQRPEHRARYEALFGPLPDVLDARFPARARPIPEAPQSPEHQAWAALSREDREAVTTAFVNIAKALAAYQRRLIQLDSPWDRALEALAAQDEAAFEQALGPEARRGLALFMGQAQCVLCHSGPMLTDLEFHNLGLPDAPGVDPMSQGRYDGVRALRDDPFHALGRYSDTTQDAARIPVAQLVLSDEQRGQFKTPSLRNVALRAPYMHGGHFATLEEVVRFYDELPGQALVGHREELLRPLNLTAQQRRDLVAFLKTLTGRPEDASWFGPPRPTP